MDDALRRKSAFNIATIAMTTDIAAAYRTRLEGNVISHPPNERYQYEVIHDMLHVEHSDNIIIN